LLALFLINQGQYSQPENINLFQFVVVLAQTDAYIFEAQFKILELSGIEILLLLPLKFPTHHPHTGL